MPLGHNGQYGGAMNEHLTVLLIVVLTIDISLILAQMVWPELFGHR